MSSRPPRILCWQCNEPLAHVKARGAQVAMRSEDRSIIAEQREFRGVCPVHGHVGGRVMGRHSTYSEADLRRKFPKSVWKRVKGALGKENSRRFRDALHGRYLPTPEDVAHWTQLAANECEASQ